MGKRSDMLEKVKDYIKHVKQCDTRINEENTIVKFILPLFSILEWDQSSDDVEYQHTVRDVGRTDITLKIEGVPVAIVEAKRFNDELSDQHMKQAMKYKTPARWVIVTNGQEIRVYDKRYRQKWGRIFFKLSYDKFLKHFDLLWLLSRNKIERLETVVDKFMEWEKVIRKRMKRMNGDVVKDFLSSALKEEGAKFQLIMQVIKRTRHMKTNGKKKHQKKWSYEEIKRYMDLLKERYPKSFAYFKVLTRTDGLLTKKELTERMRRELKDEGLKSRALAGIRAGICARTDRVRKERLDSETSDHHYLSINKKYKNHLRRYFISI